ncbi:MAG: NTP transferase domain-containing protein [Nitrospinae bacterium]|nr:NTP transferase domain-containing protein [Nitrospinota bacterium]
MDRLPPFAALILAAGKGTRMKADLPKVMLPVGGRPMLAWVVDTARAVGADPVVAVVGHMREVVERAFADSGVRFAVQEEQRGTGHAVACAEGTLGEVSQVVVLSGDVPLLPAGLVVRLLDAHRATGAVMTLLTCRVDDAGRYGRIVRDSSGAIVANVEAKDATPEQLALDEINAGVYVFETPFLFPALARLTCDNAGGEYYLTDLVGLAVADGLTVTGVVADDPSVVHGANTVEELAILDRLMAARR